MSRCFPYPPPGYTLSRTKYEAWIESIKLQVEREHRKAEKQKMKEKKRETEAKRRERKQRKKAEKVETNKDLDKSDITKDHIVENLCLHNKRKETGTDQLAHSNLSEEHGQAVVLHVPSSSTDSNETSNKRVRFSSPIDDSHRQAVLMQLPSERQNELDALPNKQQQLCSTSSRGHCTPQRKGPIHPHDTPVNVPCKSASNADQGFCLADRPVNIPHKSASNVDQGFSLADRRDHILPTSSQHNKSGSKSLHEAAVNSTKIVVLPYKDLFKNLDPLRLEGMLPPLQDDLEWLFNDKNLRMRAEKRQIPGQPGALCPQHSTVWHQAKHLHDVSIPALPYVLPY